MHPVVAFKQEINTPVLHLKYDKRRYKHAFSKTEENRKFIIKTISI